MAEFSFLSSSWGIELGEAAKTEISEQAESLDKWHIQEYIKDSDIRKLAHTSSLPKELARMPPGTVPPGQYLVQLTKVADITQPMKFQDEFEGGKWRLLVLDLCVGDQKFKAIEFKSVKDLGVHLPPGTKLLLYSTSKCPLRVQNGHMLLMPDSVEVLGGYVERLVESWKADKDVKENRLAWRTDGVKKNIDGEGPPLWVDFDPKKAPRGTAHRKQMEEERNEWRKGKAAVQSSETSKARESEDGPRFQKEDFTEDNVPVKTQVSAKAFAQDPNSRGKGEGKGKKGKGKGDDSAAPRRGRGRDDDYQEEKRAPQATFSLAAAIKPTKTGELPDEAVNARTTSTSQGGWDEGWDDSSWNDSSWDAGWQGRSGGGGWSGSSGGSRSKGGGKGGGSRKGGGGKKGGKGGNRGW